LPTLARLGSRLWSWWIAEIVALCPIARIGRPREDSSTAELQWGSPAFLRYPGAEPISIAHTAELPLLMAGWRRARARLRLCFSPERGLTDQLLLPRRAVYHVGSIVRMELVRITPCSLHDLLVGFQLEPQGASVLVHFVALRRAEVLEALTEMRRVGVTVHELCVRLPQGTRIPVELPLSEAQQSRRRLLRGGATLAGACAGTLAAMLGVMAWNEQNARLNAVSAAIARIEPEAEQARGILDSQLRFTAVKSALIAKRSDPTPLAVWSEVTRLLPDSAHLTRLVIKSNLVVLEGAAEAPEMLVEALEAAALFERVALTSPIVKAVQSSRYQFAIELSLATHSPLSIVDED
jgi:general secretion pathway protein L